MDGHDGGHDAALYYNRKGLKSLETLMFAGFDHSIYDIVSNVPGSFNDNTFTICQPWSPTWKAEF